MIHCIVKIRFTTVIVEKKIENMLTCLLISHHLWKTSLSSSNHNHDVVLSYYCKIQELTLRTLLLSTLLEAHDSIVWSFCEFEAESKCTQSNANVVYLSITSRRQGLVTIELTIFQIDFKLKNWLSTKHKRKYSKNTYYIFLPITN